MIDFTIGPKIDLDGNNSCRIISWPDGSCRPAHETEIALWAENEALRAELEAMKGMSAKEAHTKMVQAEELARMKDRVAGLEGALTEAEETLRLAERPALRDPVHHEEVKRLGLRIGFGALMATASAAWRDELEARGYRDGGEFVAGPCRATVVNALKIIRSAPATDNPGGDTAREGGE